MYPQAVYFPIRTLYLTLKIEQRERDMTADLAAAMAGKQVTSFLLSELMVIKFQFTLMSCEFLMFHWFLTFGI